jgi:hypothetical protein
MTTEQRTFTSTGLELGPPIPEEDWPAIRAEMEQFRADFRLLMSRWDELLGMYEGQFVAMYKGRLFHAAEPDELFKCLEDSGIDAGLAVRKYVTEQRWLLTARG